MADDADRLGDALRGRYEIDRVIGRGGMATVYLARDLRHGRQVAIKTLRADVGAALVAERFLREVEIAARLQHPHIVTLIDSSEAAGVLFYVMPFVDGESLRTRLARTGPLAIPDVLRVLRDVADALSYAHAHGVVHRDIKPDNVLLSGRHALVVDFGIAKALSDATSAATLTQGGVSLGTPAYMAPEQAAGDAHIDGRADIYSVAVLAYEMLSGRPPFEGTSQAMLAAHISATPARIDEAREGVPPALAALVARGLEKDPARRFQSADELLELVESLVSDSGATASVARRSRQRRRILVALGAVGLLLAAGAAFASVSRLRKERWVRDVAIPEIRRRIAAAASDSVSAFLLAQEAAAVLPHDSALAALWPEIAKGGVFHSTPEGARVSWTSMADTGNWRLVGTTPTDSVRVPAGIFRLRVEKSGYVALRLITRNPFLRPLLLDSVAAPDTDMVRVWADTFQIVAPGISGAPPLVMGAFRIDRHELTNRQYKRFVDAGGYRMRELWDSAMTKNGVPVPWEMAMAMFVDRTGRPGPSTWEGGAPPRGEEDFPVGGLSWYEASAYARFARKSLPTVYHWHGAARTITAAWLIPGSNLNGSGPTRGGAAAGISWVGAFDMAGNVREWCENATATKRYILGGGWTDPTYQFLDANAQDPFDRSAINGVRLARYAPNEPYLAQARAPLGYVRRDYSRERPVSDAVFESFRRMYDYDATPLNAVVEERDSSGGAWVRERISFDAAYGHERVLANLYLPKSSRPPLQTLVYFPGSGMIHAAGNTDQMRDAEANVFRFLVASGRAIMFPVYKGTLQRSDSLRSDAADESVFYRDHVLMWAKDLRRSIDYLATRSEIDTTKLAYVGLSWGGYVAGLMTAVEPRLKVALVIAGGLEMERPRPEVDPFNFLPRVTIPVLMLEADYDIFYPVETSQRPFFERLGTPNARKRLEIHPGMHVIAPAIVIRKSLDWLDQYLGPVRN